MVRALHRLNLDQPLVVESLIESFDLTEDEAKAKAQAYWSV